MLILETLQLSVTQMVTQTSNRCPIHQQSSLHDTFGPTNPAYLQRQLLTRALNLSVAETVDLSRRFRAMQFHVTELGHRGWTCNKGILTSNKELLVAPGITTRNKKPKCY